MVGEICELIEGKLVESGEVLKFGSYFDYWYEVFKVYGGEGDKQNSGNVINNETVEEKLVLVENESQKSEQIEELERSEKSGEVIDDSKDSEIEVKPEDLNHHVSYEWSLNGSIEDSEEEFGDKKIDLNVLVHVEFNGDSFLLGPNHFYIAKKSIFINFM